LSPLKPLAESFFTFEKKTFYGFAVRIFYSFNLCTLLNLKFIHQMLTSQILQSIEKSVLCWLATADAEGFPNVSPKEIFTSFGDRHLLIANVASPQTAKNIRVNSKICVSFVDILVQKGFQLKGNAQIITEKDEHFAALAAPLLKITGGKFPFKELFYIEVEKVKPIIAPRYWMYPETTEAEQVESARKVYGI